MASANDRRCRPKPHHQPQAASASNSTILHLLLILPIALICVVSICAVCQGVFTDSNSVPLSPRDPRGQFCMNALDFYSVLLEWLWNNVTDWNMYLIQSATTASALSWLLYRAWQTLWKPVPELISILGVEVPDAPEVSISGIQPTSLTLHWTRPVATKPVIKYLIQVNGVNVGDSMRLETSITVTGLKPGHYYNVRIIAVGTNNFQSGSSVLRLRTLGRNGRPKLEGCNGSSDPSDDEDEVGSIDKDNGGGRRNTVGVEAAPLPETSQAMAREQSNGNTSQRRNTVGRKHSPSTAGADQAARDAAVSNLPEESMNQLAEKFESIRRENDEITAQIARDVEEFRFTMAELARDRDEKKQMLKEKEEVSDQLRREAVTCERLNRDAQNKKTQKENIMAGKETIRKKRKDDMARWKNEIEEMRLEREEWRDQAEKIQLEKDSKVSELRDESSSLLQTIKSLEEDIHQKGLQIKELELERSKLPGAQNDEEIREQDDIDKREDFDWKRTEDDLLRKINTNNQTLQEIANVIQENQILLGNLQAANALMYHGNSSGIDFDPTGTGKTKSRRTRNRKSRTNTVSSPVAAYPSVESTFPSASAYSNIHNTTSPSFAPGPYIDMNNDLAMVPLSEQMHGMSEEDVRMLTAGAPLSPTATSLLPSNIFADDEPPSPGGDSFGSFGRALYGGMPFEKEPQSPDSSSRSASRMSSPQNSAHNLALYGVASYRDDNDRRSLNSPRTDFGAIGSVPPSEPSTHKGIRDLFTLPSRARGKTSQDGPALGSLKHGQSQSFPRSLEEPDTLANRARRMSFTTNWPGFGRRGVTSGESSIQGNAPAPARNLGARRRRGFNMFSNSMDENSIHSERDPSSPRPVSIASSGPGELPRPSTDSAPFGWAPAPDALVNRNSPLATNWSVHAPTTWSRNPSRRPSIQHGSSTALNIGIASEDDEIIYPSDTRVGHASPPPNVGVIGTRPPSSHKPITPKLNPAAPAFKGLIFKTASSEADKEKPKSKGKGKATDSSPSDEFTQMPSSSPTTSRKSRDTPSIHTQNSMAESYDSLDRTSSNTPSDAPTPGATAKEKESAGSLRDLLRRKGSSSKFSLSSLRHIGGKKAAGSATNSDRNASVERDGSFDEYSEDAGLGRSIDSVTSSPMIGSNTSGEFKPRERESAKEGRMSMNWGRFGLTKGKGKGREAGDVDKSESELTTEDEG